MNHLKIVFIVCCVIIYVSFHEQNWKGFQSRRLCKKYKSYRDMTIWCLIDDCNCDHPNAVSICTRILKYRVWKIEFDELDFLSISNSNFAGYTGSKNLVQTRQKFQFIKVDFSNSIFQNPSADRYRDRYPWLSHSFKTGWLVTFVHLSVDRQTHTGLYNIDHYFLCLRDRCFGPR